MPGMRAAAVTWQTPMTGVLITSTSGGHAGMQSSQPLQVSVAIVTVPSPQEAKAS